ncbi:hypothetical protein BM221_004497 [Beauveria bassiana]|uniref:Uncharacterized protein n=1 Tax=Beauveria bassiana TaxID=176275 RepID=A0A2N6NRE5_BEABA|nr:hypothetical protein BM221_004497 [Beauveria bassiana]
MDSTSDKEDEQPLLFYHPKDVEASNKVPKQIQRLHLVALYLYCIGVSVALGILLAQNRDPNISVYSPANTAISYWRTTFEPGTPDQPSRYQGEPNEVNNQLWEALYKGSRATRITRSEAQKLVNASNVISEGDDEHLIQLEVFHQLHCLINAFLSLQSIDL